MDPFCVSELQGTSGREASGRQVPVDVNLTGEDLATAICCDARTRPYAEPQFFFQRPEIDLSPATMEPDGRWEETFVEHDLVANERRRLR